MTSNVIATLELSWVTKPLLTPDEFRMALDGALGRNTVYALLKSGRIKSVRVGRKYLIPASEVVNFPLREAEEGAL